VLCSQFCCSYKSKDYFVAANDGDARHDVLCCAVTLPCCLLCCSYKGEDYFVAANEGDTRQYPGLNEEKRVLDIAAKLDPVAFPNAATLVADANMGRLRILTGGESFFPPIQCPFALPASGGCSPSTVQFSPILVAQLLLGWSCLQFNSHVVSVKE
jgi:hypothetical protein